MCALTPETEKSTHFFWAVPRNFNPEQEVTDMMYQGSKAVFEEDVDILNRQQEVLGKRGDNLNWQNVHSDAGAVYARRIIKELLSSEGGLNET